MPPFDFGPRAKLLGLIALATITLGITSAIILHLGSRVAQQRQAQSLIWGETRAARELCAVYFQWEGRTNNYDFIPELVDKCLGNTNN